MPNLAFSIMRRRGADDLICRSFAVVMEFLENHPQMITKRRDTDEGISPDFMERLAPAFLAGRYRNGPVLPTTIPDPVVKDILRYTYNVPLCKLDAAVDFHLQAMGAENFIGWILEAYIAYYAEPEGWAWCSGELVRFVDFIKPENGGWQLLQVKNRSNSENSASSSVRIGTPIQKWFRTFAATGKTNWEAFPDVSLRKKLSEDGFRTFIISCLKLPADRSLQRE